MNDVMYRTGRQLTRADILPLPEYAQIRRQRRRPHIRDQEAPPDRGRARTPPSISRNLDTMWQQIQEMLFIEKGGESQIADELEAYNPLIPQGDELVATVMFEIGDPPAAPASWRDSAASRTRRLSRSPATASAASRTRPARTPAPRARPRRCSSCASGSRPSRSPRFRHPAARIMLGFDHPNYGHIAVMPEPVRAALTKDFD
jgi:hypothetical protein